MGKIDMTGVDLKELAKAAYDLSVPQGLGFLHFREGGLSDDEAQGLVDRPTGNEGGLYLDYVRGRACKLSVFCENGQLYMSSPWYDHTDEQLKQLLERVGIPAATPEEKHGIACNCSICRGG